MVSTEKVFDMLPVVVELYDKLDIDTYRKDLEKENVGKRLNKNDLGINIFKYVLKNSLKVKNEFFEIASIFEEKTIEEVKAQSFGKTINVIKEVFTDKETLDFFKSAM